MQFMTPPDPTNLDTLRDSGGKMIVIQGGADGVFSPDDTASWYEELDAAYKKKAGDFVRYFEVPGMGHVSGGPATDQFDGLVALVAWVEQGDAPDRIIATARGEGNPAGVNTEIPASWSADRTRPLCVFPLVARYKKGDPESADSFVCAKSRADKILKHEDKPGEREGLTSAINATRTTVPLRQGGGAVVFVSLRWGGIGRVRGR